MAAIHRLSARAVATLKEPGLYADGGGLYLQVTLGRDDKPRRSWVVRYTARGGPRREMGLGDAVLVTLADARESASEARRQARAGIDPIAARAEARIKAKAARIKAMSFRECAEAYIAAHQSTWKNPKHRWQWRRTLEMFAYPVFGNRPVAGVDVAGVTAALDPIWLTRTETASRLRGRIEAVLDWATVRGLRTGENPARWKGHLQKALPAINRSKQVRHHPALPYADMPTFMRALKTKGGVAAAALTFCILTATRTGETINARWAEFDLEQRLWIIPAERMKMGRAHRVPLSDATIDILRAMRAEATEDTGLVFPSRRADKALSNMALLAVLKRMGRTDLTTHGFRSTFRDWAAECTHFPAEVSEAALAHAVADKVEAAYRRGDLFEKRRVLMNAWSEHCAADPRANSRSPTAA